MPKILDLDAPRTQLYWAYGSNLNVAQMTRRCPAAVKVGPLRVPNAVLRFRGVADVAYLEGAKCPGGLWEITDACEAALDRYEGCDLVNPRRGLYQKKYLRLRMADGTERACLYYQMTRRIGVSPPAEFYFRGIAEGYDDFGLGHRALDRALAHSWNRKNRTPAILRRYERAGRPALARPDETWPGDFWPLPPGA
jgi:hypothetical protein